MSENTRFVRQKCIQSIPRIVEIEGKLGELAYRKGVFELAKMARAEFKRIGEDRVGLFHIVMLFGIPNQKIADQIIHEWRQQGWLAYDDKGFYFTIKFQIAASKDKIHITNWDVKRFFGPDNHSNLVFV